MYVPACFCKSTFLFVFVLFFFFMRSVLGKGSYGIAQTEMLGVKIKTQNKWMSETPTQEPMAT